MNAVRCPLRRSGTLISPGRRRREAPPRRRGSRPAAHPKSRTYAIADAFTVSSGLFSATQARFRTAPRPLTPGPPRSRPSPRRPPHCRLEPQSTRVRLATGFGKRTSTGTGGTVMRSILADSTLATARSHPPS